VAGVCSILRSLAVKPESLKDEIVVRPPVLLGAMVDADDVPVPPQSLPQAQRRCKKPAGRIVFAHIMKGTGTGNRPRWAEAWRCLLLRDKTGSFGPERPGGGPRLCAGDPCDAQAPFAVTCLFLRNRPKSSCDIL